MPEAVTPPQLKIVSVPSSLSWRER
jgi:hypothetical protein